MSENTHEVHVFFGHGLSLSWPTSNPDGVRKRIEDAIHSVHVHPLVGRPTTVVQVNGDGKVIMIAVDKIIFFSITEIGKSSAPT